MAETTQTPAKPKTHRYVVCSDAVVVTIGTKKNGRADYTRILRGGVVNGVEGSEQIETLVRAGALKQVTSKEQLAEVQADLVDPARSKYRQTVRKSAAAMGAPDDPVAAPLKGVEPLPAGNPTISPDAILADDTTE